MFRVIIRPVLPERSPSGISSLSSSWAQHSPPSELFHRDTSWRLKTGQNVPLKQHFDPSKTDAETVPRHLHLLFHQATCPYKPSSQQGLLSIIIIIIIIIITENNLSSLHGCHWWRGITRRVTQKDMRRRLPSIKDCHNLWWNLDHFDWPCVHCWSLGIKINLNLCSFIIFLQWTRIVKNGYASSFQT